MKEKPSCWADYIEESISISISPDSQKAKSLIEISSGRIKYMNKELNENTSNYIFEDYYTSILELLEAIVLLKGYKVSNHLCLGFYLRDVLKKEDLFRIFDGLRYKRNSLVYYGKRMEFEISKKAINDAKELISELNLLIKELKEHGNKT